MESAEFLTVYDSRWFETEIFGSTESSPDSPPDSPTLASMYLQIQKQQQQQQQTPAASSITRLNRSTMIRSISDNVYSKPTFDSGESSDSPDSVLAPPPTQHRKKSRFVGSMKIEGSKSMTSLEFEELKGFMDLGFVFSEEDKDYPRLVSILPALQRLGKTEESPVPPPARPYLSEAWAVKEEEERKQKEKEIVSPLVNWRAPIGNEVELKDSLKLWAHTVASTVRI